jgi:hypothetical protein
MKSLVLLCLAIVLLHPMSTASRVLNTEASRAGEAHEIRHAELATNTRPLQVASPLPLTFEPNVGQAPPESEFVGRGAGYGISFTAGGVELTVNSGSRVQDRRSQRAVPLGSGRTGRDVLAIDWIGANPGVHGVAEEKLASTSNYFIGNDASSWIRNVATFGSVRYPDVYPGVDVRYHGRGKCLEYDFELAPGADPAQIAFTISGHKAIRLTDAGGIDLELSSGTVHVLQPVAYQLGDNERTAVSAGFEMRGDGEIRFRLEPYDRSAPLVIDPVIVYSEYISGSFTDSAQAVQLDESGSVYVTGETSSLDFPTTPGAYDTTGSAVISFVAKLGPDGHSLVYSTYFGGSTMTSSAYDLAIDATGAAYVSGYTTANDLPTTPGAYQRSPAGNGDGFVFKLSPDGSELLYSTLVGGSQVDEFYCIAVDTSNNAYVAGQTLSPDYPTSPGAFDTSYSGSSDIVMSKLDATGATLVYSSFLGGDSAERPGGIAVDASGAAYVTGGSALNFPVTPGAFTDGTCDVFITKMNSSGTALVYSSCFGGGGAGAGFGYRIVVDDAGAAYVAGETGDIAFPTTDGAFDRSLNGDQDAFVVKLGPDGRSLVYSTLVGGMELDYASGLAVDSEGVAYITGATMSTDYPTSPDALDRLLNSLYDVFVTVVSPDGGSLFYSTYLPGIAFDFPGAIATDNAGGVVVVGSTISNDLTTGGFGVLGNFSAFVLKIQLEPRLLRVAGVSPATAEPRQKLTVTIVGDRFEKKARVSFGDGIKVLSVKVVSETRIDVQIKVKKNALPGSRDVTVTNRDGGTAVGMDVFTVG